MSDTRGILLAAIGAGSPSTDFDLNPEVRPERRALRPAGVLVAVREADAGPRVILTRRSAALKHHPGQIAFPGGKVDPGDADETAAALREAEEEIGLPPASVDVLGRLPAHETVTGFCVMPVIGLVTGGWTPRAEAGEVEEIFEVPLAHLTDPGRFQIQSRDWHGRKRRYYVIPWGPYYIWGATARMLRVLAGRLG